MLLAAELLDMSAAGALISPAGADAAASGAGAGAGSGMGATEAAVPESVGAVWSLLLQAARDKHARTAQIGISKRRVVMEKTSHQSGRKNNSEKQALHSKRQHNACLISVDHARRLCEFFRRHSACAARGHSSEAPP
jgi:hypothetical protein